MSNFGNFKGLGMRANQFKANGGFGHVVSRAVNESVGNGFTGAQRLDEAMKKVISKGSKLVITFNNPPNTDDNESYLDDSLVGSGGPSGDFSWSPGSNQKEAIYTARKDVTNFDKQYGKLIKDAKVKVKILDPSGKLVESLDNNTTIQSLSEAVTIKRKVGIPELKGKPRLAGENGVYLVPKGFSLSKGDLVDWYEHGTGNKYEFKVNSYNVGKGIVTLKKTSGDDKTVYQYQLVSD